MALKAADVVAAEAAKLLDSFATGPCDEDMDMDHSAVDTMAVSDGAPHLCLGLFECGERTPRDRTRILVPLRAGSRGCVVIGQGLARGSLHRGAAP